MPIKKTRSARGKIKKVLEDPKRRREFVKRALAATEVKPSEIDRRAGWSYGYTWGTDKRFGIRSDEKRHRIESRARSENAKALRRRELGKKRVYALTPKQKLWVVESFQYYKAHARRYFNLNRRLFEDAGWSIPLLEEEMRKYCFDRLDIYDPKKGVPTQKFMNVLCRNFLRVERMRLIRKMPKERPVTFEDAEGRTRMAVETVPTEALLFIPHGKPLPTKVKDIRGIGKIPRGARTFLKKLGANFHELVKYDYNDIKERILEIAKRANLSQTEGEVLSMRLDGMTGKETGKALAKPVTKERVRQIEVGIAEKMEMLFKREQRINDEQ